MKASHSSDRVWLGLFGKKDIENYFVWAETQMRFSASAQNIQQTLNRVGILKALNPRHEVGFLYGLVSTSHPTPGLTTQEHRPTLQHVYTTSNQFLVRSRLEYRRVEGNPDISWRFRSFLRYSKPLSNDFSFVLWDEPFLNVSRENWTGNRLLERNRLFIGFRKSYAQIAFEFGYLNQTVPRNTQTSEEHTLVLYAFF